jgi:hypothetical protein
MLPSLRPGLCGYIVLTPPEFSGSLKSAKTEKKVQSKLAKAHQYLRRKKEEV